MLGIVHCSRYVLGIFHCSRYMLGIVHYALDICFVLFNVLFNFDAYLALYTILSSTLSRVLCTVPCIHQKHSEEYEEYIKRIVNNTKLIHVSKFESKVDFTRE